MRFNQSVCVLLTLIVWQTCQADWQHLTVAGAGDVPLSVVTAGDPESPSIVFVHGIGQSHYSFVHQLNSDLADDFYLVAFDLRGHADSGKPWRAEDYAPSVWAADLRAVMDATGAHRPVIVAWSYGTLVLMDYLREFGPDGLAAVNLTGGLGAVVPMRMPRNDPNTEKFLRLRKLRESPNLADRISANQQVGVWLTAKPMADADRRVVDAVAQMLPAYARTAMTQRPFDNQDLLEKLTVPVRLSLGGKDNPLQLEDGIKLAEDHKNISVSVFQESGHSVFFEEPERFNAELRQFVKETAAGR